ncbi:MAG: helix-turn-helix domain-containing protein [Candidatus Moranbacteria bacterium]|nr:helix-turn-helix domain-containing protein [Candidatus Moranbacteria bacterium]
MNASDKLKLIKDLSELTQEKLAKELGVSFVTLNSWINGRSVPRKKKQIQIDELYARYSGTKIIPETVLEAKKKVLEKKSRSYRNIAATISNNSDIYDQFVLSLTYNTNKIEGSTLTEDETAAILFGNASLPNRTLIEQLEAKNHQTAFNFMFDWLKEKKAIDEDLILRLHSILMNSIRPDAGTYRSHGVRIMGTNMPTANYLKVPELMKKIIKDINVKKADFISKLSNIHSRFEQIHPFSDGNGRIGRLLMHAMLLKQNFPPAMIQQKDKRIYMKYLNKSQMTGDLSLLEDFLCDAIMLSFSVMERR